MVKECFYNAVRRNEEDDEDTKAQIAKKQKELQVCRKAARFVALPFLGRDRDFLPRQLEQFNEEVT